MQITVTEAKKIETIKPEIEISALVNTLNLEETKALVKECFDSMSQDDIVDTINDYAEDEDLSAAIISALQDD